MTTIIRFQTRDLREFDEAAPARAHEKLLDAIDALTLRLPPLPVDDGKSFANGTGFLQHAPHRVREVKEGIIALWGGDADIQREAVHLPPFSSALCGLLSDSNSPLYPLWWRLGCIDRQWREWGQPYFALHPLKGKHIRLNRIHG